MRIAITGSAGFVGSALIEELLKTDYTLRLIQHQNVLYDSSDSDIKTVTADIHEYDEIEKALKDVDVVFHLVGIIAETKENTFDKTVVTGTRNLVKAAKKNNLKKIIFVSATGTGPDAKSRYHQTKWLAEEAIRNSGIDYIIFRPSAIFGPGDKFLNMIADMIRKYPMLPIVGDGKYKLQPVYVEDLAKILCACLTNKKAVGQTIEMGGPKAYKYIELIKILKKTLNKKSGNIYLPVGFVRPMAGVMEKIMKSAPITKDQLIMMQEGSETNNKLFNDLFDFELTKLEDKITEYMR